jgi:hypothetical protein
MIAAFMLIGLFSGLGTILTFVFSFDCYTPKHKITLRVVSACLAKFGHLGTWENCREASCRLDMEALRMDRPAYAVRDGKDK